MYRLEFLQPDGRWCGPYCAEYMTARGFELRDLMMAEHLIDDPGRPWPDPEIFARSPGGDRYVCGTASIPDLTWWFGHWLHPLMHEGGHLGSYEVPQAAVAVNDGAQIIYMQRQGVMHRRIGTPVDPQLLIERFHPNKLFVAPVGVVAGPAQGLDQPVDLGAVQRRPQ